MKRQELQEKLREGVNLVEQERYAEAVNIFDALNLDSVRSPGLLQRIAKSYEKCRRFLDAEDILLQAHQAAPKSRGTLYHLTVVALKAGETENAEEYYEKFCEVAGNDAARHVLKYRIAKSRRASDEELISILENFREEEPDDRWMYELARLYAANGRTDDAVEVCNTIMLWYNSGKYWEMARELKSALTGEEPEPAETEAEEAENAEAAAAEETGEAAERQAETVPDAEAAEETEAEASEDAAAEDMQGDVSREEANEAALPVTPVPDYVFAEIPAAEKTVPETPAAISSETIAVPDAEAAAEYIADGEAVAETVEEATAEGLEAAEQAAEETADEISEAVEQTADAYTDRSGARDILAGGIAGSAFGQAAGSVFDDLEVDIEENRTAAKDTVTLADMIAAANLEDMYDAMLSGEKNAPEVAVEEVAREAENAAEAAADAFEETVTESAEEAEIIAEAAEETLEVQAEEAEIIAEAAEETLEVQAEEAELAAEEVLTAAGETGQEMAVIAAPEENAPAVDTEAPEETLRDTFDETAQENTWTADVPYVISGLEMFDRAEEDAEAAEDAVDAFEDVLAEEAEAAEETVTESAEEAADTLEDTFAEEAAETAAYHMADAEETAAEAAETAAYYVAAADDLDDILVYSEDAPDEADGQEPADAEDSAAGSQFIVIPAEEDGPAEKPFAEARETDESAARPFFEAPEEAPEADGLAIRPFFEAPEADEPEDSEPAAGPFFTAPEEEDELEAELEDLAEEARRQESAEDRDVRADRIEEETEDSRPDEHIMMTVTNAASQVAREKGNAEDTEDIREKAPQHADEVQIFSGFEDHAREIREKLERRAARSARLGRLPLEIDVSRDVWHFMVFGENDELTLECAREKMKEIADISTNAPRKMLKLRAERIVNANIIHSLDRFLGNMVIVEEASKLSDQQLLDFSKVLDKDDQSLLVAFTDTEDNLAEMFRRVPELSGSFTAVYEGKDLTVPDLVGEVKEYLFNNDARLTEDGEEYVNAYADRIMAEGKGFYKNSMRKLAAKALKHAEHGGFLGLSMGKVDEDGYLLVSEKYFKKAENQ